jgi:hypothetical protein
MAKIREGYRIINRSEGLALIENYFRSGQGAREYYKQQGITECQFYGWRRRYLALHPEVENTQVSVNGKTKKRFHPVELEKVIENQLSGFEIHYPNGVRVVVSSQQGIEIVKLKALIKIEI